MLTKDQMLSTLKTMGLNRPYKPSYETETDHITLETRKPVRIVDGVMKGCDIDIYDQQTVRVWTSRKKKAAAIARANGFRVHLLDGEAELYLPADRADGFLHAFGAKVKQNRKPLSPEVLAKHLDRLRLAREKRKMALAIPA